jgi:hypothetical protein
LAELGMIGALVASLTVALPGPLFVARLLAAPSVKWWLIKVEGRAVNTLVLISPPPDLTKSNRD